LLSNAVHPASHSTPGDKRDHEVNSLNTWALRASKGIVLRIKSPLRGCHVNVIWQSDSDKGVFFNPDEVLGIIRVKIVTKRAAVGYNSGFLGWFVRADLFYLLKS
jgi:hypothetical protein